MTDNDRTCGCHTVYLVQRGGGLDEKSLRFARTTPGAIISVNNPDDIFPMIFHTCGRPSTHWIVRDRQSAAEEGVV